MGKRKRSGHKDARFVEINDRISDLPDDVIYCILSSLTMRDAVKTSVLSRRWRQLWTYNPHLIFDGENMLVDTLNSSFEGLDTKSKYALKERTRKFIQSVNEFLLHHQGTGVETFKVNSFLHMKHAPDLDRWISFAVASGAKELDLDLDEARVTHSPKMLYDFPFWLFANRKGSSLKRLHLKHCSLRSPPNFDGFNSLKELLLSDVCVSELGITNLLSSCSVLERLRVWWCKELVNLMIFDPSSRLKYLDVNRCFNLKKIEVFATSLVTFEYSGCRISFTIKSAPRLTRASIFLTSQHTPDAFNYVLTGLPGDLSRLETLFLMFFKPPENECLPSSYHKFTCLKNLTISVLTSWKEDILWVASLLKAAPFVENFHLQLSCRDASVEKRRKVRRPSKCPHNSLQTVEIGGFTGAINQIELVIYLFNSASTLKLVLIDPRWRRYKGDHRWFYGRNLCPYSSDSSMNKVRAKATRYLTREVPTGVELVIL